MDRVGGIGQVAFDRVQRDADGERITVRRAQISPTRIEQTEDTLSLSPRRFLAVEHELF